MGQTFIEGTEGQQFDTHSTQRYELGSTLRFKDGREFKYAEAGGTALVAGSLYQSEVPNANWDELAVATASAIGDRSIDITLGSQAVSADDFRDGYLGIEDDAGEGIMYHIARHGAASASTTFTAPIRHGVDVALTTASTAILLKNPFKDVIIHPSPPTAAVVGVAVKAVAANEFGWLQTKGQAMVLTEGTLVIGQPVRPSETTDGAVTPMDYDEGAAADESIVGTCIAVSATGEHSPIMLSIHGT